VFVGKENMKLPNLKLATVAETFLPEEQGKIDLHFTKIPEYFNGTDAMRTELCVYCLRDAEIPIKLAVCLNAVNSVVERGRVTRLPLDWVPSRGTVMRFTSLLLAKVRERQYVIPWTPPVERGVAGPRVSTYEGAYVVPTDPGFFQYVVVVDFAAQYPSAIIAENLDYLTYTTDAKLAAKLNGFSIVPGHFFIPSDVVMGVVPEILQDLLAARKRIKLKLAACKDPLQRRVLQVSIACLKLYL